MTVLGTELLLALGSIYPIRHLATGGDARAAVGVLVVLAAAVVAFVAGLLATHLGWKFLTWNCLYVAAVAWTAAAASGRGGGTWYGYLLIIAVTSLV
ncbi:MAG: hypothetical protein J0H43_12415, partial [Actinobacteria bacterium]|nr:hypothetical protein [Actinomycetota bacterium]